MINWLRAVARTIAFRFPLILKALRFVNKNATRLREVRNVNSLLSELHSDTALQLPLLVEQNRKMFRELEVLKLEVERLKQHIQAEK